MSETPKPLFCIHGQLARSCEICDLERELQAEREKVGSLHAKLQDVKHKRDELKACLREVLYNIVAIDAEHESFGYQSGHIDHDEMIRWRKALGEDDR